MEGVSSVGGGDAPPGRLRRAACLAVSTTVDMTQLNRQSAVGPAGRRTCLAPTPSGGHPPSAVARLVLIYGGRDGRYGKTGAHDFQSADPGRGRATGELANPMVKRGGGTQKYVAGPGPRHCHHGGTIISGGHAEKHARSRQRSLIRLSGG